MSETSYSIDKSLFEKVMIYNCLMDTSYLEAVIEHTKPSFFDNENIRMVYQEISNFYSTYKKVPNITELKLHITEPEKRQSLKDVVISFSGIDKEYDKDVLLKITEKFLRERTVLQTVQKTSLDIQSGSVDSGKILKDFEKACSISLLDNHGFDYLEEIDKHCEDLQKVFKTISTGWKWLDEKLGGGFMAEGRSFYLFFGQTNVGKSIFLGNIATNVLSQNKTVVLITLEMPESVYAKRISSQLSKVPFSDLKDQIEVLKGSLNEYKIKNRDAKLIIKEFPPKAVSPLQIKGYIQKLKRKGITPDLIVIDYLSLLAPPTLGKNSYESQKEVAEQVRALSYEFECSVVSAVQINRDGYNQSDPELDTTSESMGISHTVDAQISIWTEEDDIDLGIIHMGIAKNRFGPRKCSTVLEIDYPTLSLRDPDEVSNGFVQPLKTNKREDTNKKLNDNTSVKSTLDIISSLGEDDD